MLSSKKKPAMFLLALAGAALSGSLSAAGQDAAPQYFIRPSDVQIPEGLDWGQYRRTVQPFKNWTLICDENLKKMEKICNISQIIVDRSDAQVFSWSLAATKDGAPMMILRTPATTDRKIPIRVLFPGRDKPVLINIEGCDDNVCVAIMPVGPITREHIGKSSEVTFIYALEAGRQVKLSLPLQGIAIALGALQ